MANIAHPAIIMRSQAMRLDPIIFMPEIKFSIKNYRCFSDSQPAIFILKNGFTSFVGPNNSGKTSILKFFYEIRPLFKLLSYQGISLYRNSRDSPFSRYQYFARENEEPQKDKIIQLSQNLFYAKNDRDLSLEITTLIFDDEKFIPIEIEICIPRNELNSFLIRVIDTSQNQVINLDSTTQTASAVRSLFGVLSDTIYIGSFRNALSVQSVYLEDGGDSQISRNQKYFDIRFGHDFYALWSELKYGRSKNNHRLAYQITESIKSIFNFKSLEINSSASDYTLLLTINGESFSLDELGSGLSQILLVLVNAAVSHPSLIMIDEPELNLHSSLQLDFLTSLASFSKSGIMFSTHSIGLARSISESIYVVFRDINDQSVISDFETMNSLPELLGELNFSSHSSLGFNKILLVEGVTEVKTIQQFLRKLNKDKDILLIPLGGSQLIRDSIEFEMLELKRISASLFALVDSEKNHEEDDLDSNRTHFISLCKKIGIECLVLEKRATENYFSDRAVKAVKGEKYRALKPYEKLKSLDFSWSKSDNWRIARAMNLSEIKDTDLGRFLSRI